MHQNHTILRELTQLRNAVRTLAFRLTHGILRHMAPRLALSALALLITTAGASHAQSAVSTAAPGVVAQARSATREALEQAAAQLDRLASSTAYSAENRLRARGQAAQVRRRLTDGDFRVGDRLVLAVGGSVVVDDTVTVLDGPRIDVRGIRQVSLSGVLRSELDRKLLADLTEVVRNATVTARPLLRMAVFGSVVQPGYLSVPSETTLDHVLTLAGGPVADAAAQQTALMRGDTLLLDRKQVMLAIVDGTTLEELGVIDGDALIVPPRRPPWDRSTTLSIVSLLFIPLITIFGISR